jgi:anti-anti-sigma factor
MAKYRHRIFEMFELRDEAIRELTSRARKDPTDATASESWTLKQLAVWHYKGLTHVQFREPQAFDEKCANELGQDFAQLAEKLTNDSKVVLDFEGVASFGSASINALILFSKKLQTKGSRMVLCCLEPAVRESFFVHHDYIRTL